MGRCVQWTTFIMNFSPYSIIASPSKKIPSRFEMQMHSPFSNNADSTETSGCRTFCEGMVKSHSWMPSCARWWTLRENTLFIYPLHTIKQRRQRSSQTHIIAHGRVVDGQLSITTMEGKQVHGAVESRADIAKWSTAFHCLMERKEIINSPPPRVRFSENVQLIEVCSYSSKETSTLFYTQEDFCRFYNEASSLKSRIKTWLA